MDLGAFSVSLSVKDLDKSLAFYGALGFEPVAGSLEEQWLVMRNGEHVIGLFQGMFDKNMLTFNPGWDQHGRETSEFTDVRELQAELKRRGLSLSSEAASDGDGPASCVLIDPDGNPILIDQHR